MQGNAIVGKVHQYLGTVGHVQKYREVIAAHTLLGVTGIVHRPAASPSRPGLVAKAFIPFPIVCRSMEATHPASSFIASSAARSVCKISSSVCATLTNHASNCDGGRYTPRCNIAWKNVANFWVLLATALA